MANTNGIWMATLWQWLGFQWFLHEMFVHLNMYNNKSGSPPMYVFLHLSFCVLLWTFSFSFTHQYVFPLFFSILLCPFFFFAGFLSPFYVFVWLLSFYAQFPIPICLPSLLCLSVSFALFHVFADFLSSFYVFFGLFYFYAQFPTSICLPSLCPIFSPRKDKGQDVA